MISGTFRQKDSVRIASHEDPIKTANKSASRCGNSYISLRVRDPREQHSTVLARSSGCGGGARILRDAWLVLRRCDVTALSLSRGSRSLDSVISAHLYRTLRRFALTLNAVYWIISVMELCNSRSELSVSIHHIKINKIEHPAYYIYYKIHCSKN